ncbi:MAG TPA: phenylalanine--tRNA ligase subunit beta [Candidatus Hydrogenedentes bacterium]|nr:phenylalanine--tRNA ligase subunit beta [Candidatus Hydrogenedentota bacterium]HPG65317.1 phenylalanine--tRNA ligase subunit beta [Candidatus Hydrogenedentota bacterium]
MRISLNWLREFIDIDIDVDTLAHKMTMLGIEIEAIERPWQGITGVYVGEIRSIEPHPNADKLVVCKTDVGRDQPLQIVCGATNMKVGDRVPTSVVGAKLVGGFEIAARKMRGVPSEGMMCAADELGLGEDHSGLMILDPSIPIGTDCIPLLGLDDVVFDVEITPNRGDCASMIGVARELSALLGVPYRVPEVRITETSEPATQFSSVTIEAPDLCPRYIGRVLPSVRVRRSPAWMCQRLIAAGQRPISNVVDITNYVLLETGHPLHAFDYGLLEENRVVVRRARAGEVIITIDGDSHPLSPEMLVIADAVRPVAVAGIMGGKESEVGEETSRIFLESACFDPVSIRRSSRALGLQTEASAHFQRGADVDMCLYACNRAAALMQELADGVVAAGLLDEHPRPPVRKTVQLRYDRANLLLGADIPAHTQRGYIQSLGFDVVEASETACTFRAPTWRHDVSQEADLIEDVARLYGYDKIAATLPSISQVEQVFAPFEARVRRLRALLVGAGLTEMMHWTFSQAADVRKSELPDAYLDMVALANPLSENLSTMRSSLIPGLLDNVTRNLHRGNGSIRAFEIGPVYKPRADKDLPDETLRIAVVLTGAAASPHWASEQRSVDFYDLKGIMEVIADHVGAVAAYQPLEMGPFQTGQSASVVVDGRELASMGLVKSTVLKAYDIEQPVYVLDADLQALLALNPAAKQFEEIPQYPPSLRDIAVLVDNDVPAGALCEAARDAAGKILRSVDIFDVYTGKQVPEGKKSVALSLVFQSPERTLTDQNTQKAWDKILHKLETEFNATLR